VGTGGERTDAPRSRGLPASLRELAKTLLAIVHTRAELVALEFARERARVLRVLLLAVAALFMLALGALTATIFIIVLFWDSQRLVVIGFLAAVYLAAGVAMVFAAKREAARVAHPFASSLEALKKDSEELTSR
jgi:uncharacterized membrane protein YqjE